MHRIEILKWEPLILLIFCFSGARGQCKVGCDLAYGSYIVKERDGLDALTATVFTNVAVQDIMTANGLLDKNFIQSGFRLKIPFSCDCINRQYLGHSLVYPLKSGDTYAKIAGYYSNLTSAAWLRAVNGIADADLLPSKSLKVVVNCSCGDRKISREYGLFLTYFLKPGDSITGLSINYSISPDTLKRYNPLVDFNQGSDLIFIPVKDLSGSYRPLKSKEGIGTGAIIAISIVIIIVAVMLAAFIYTALAKRKKKDRVLFYDSEVSLVNGSKHLPGSINQMDETSGVASSGKLGITLDKSVEFSYEELSNATNQFSVANKIGEGGYGAVYYAELRRENAAVKRMDMEATREFLAELKVLTRAHHLNLVKLIGYCTERSLFLVYEFIDNGNLSQHLRDAGRKPLSWPARVQIAIDSARGLEYIHEYTVPVYIHRDIKSANILIDNNLRAKVADFGLAKLTEVGGSSQTNLVGTFGYMPPEYANYGDLSPKVDVYAFGVVLYELISAKEAVLKTGVTVAESKGLVALFESIFREDDPKKSLQQELVDPRLGEDYSLDSVYKMAQLAKLCTHKFPENRPSMRSVVVALTTLASSSQDWDVGNFNDGKALINLMYGK